MKIQDAGSDDRSRRVIEEIAFQASILALHAAIESASNGGPSIAAREDADQVHRLVERARHAGRPGFLGLPDMRGF